MLILETQGSDKMALLKQAIDNKYEISFWYRGVKVSDPNNKKYTKQNWRFAQPVAVGYSPKDISPGQKPQLMLRAWQKGGITNTVKPAWKTFLVDEMKNITVFDGKDGVYYRPFDLPDGNDYNDLHDLKMLNGRPIIKIDPSTPPGPNLGQKVQKSVEPKPEVGPKIAEPVHPKPKDEPAVTKGMKEPIHKPEEDNSISKQIIKTKKGNIKEPPKEPNKNKPGIKPESKPEEPAPIQMEPEEEEQLQESWLMWFKKLLTNESR